MVIRSIDGVLGLFQMQILLFMSFFFLGFMKSVDLGGRGKCWGTMKVEKSAKITKQQKGENEITDACK